MTLDRRAFLASAAALGVAASARADVSPPLRLVGAELPPYTFHVPPPSVSEIGTPLGSIHDTVVEMAHRLGHPGVVEYMPWARAQDLTMRGDGYAILALTRSPEREPHYIWAVRILVDDLILVAGNGVDASALDKIKNRPIGVLLRSGAEAFVREQGFTRVEPQPEEWLNARRMRAREIDAWLAPRSMVIWAYREIGGDASTLNIPLIVRASELYLAMSRTVPEAEVARWQKAFAELQADGTYDRIMARYRRMKIEPIPDERRQGEIDWRY
jgi:polar amino acid transport system substrate-binding protein